MVPFVPVSLYNGISLNLYTNALKSLTAKIGSEPWFKLYFVRGMTRNGIILKCWIPVLEFPPHSKSGCSTLYSRPLNRKMIPWVLVWGWVLHSLNEVSNHSEVLQMLHSRPLVIQLAYEFAYLLGRIDTNELRIFYSINSIS